MNLTNQSYYKIIIDIDVYVYIYIYVYTYELETKSVVLGIILLNSVIFVTKLYYNFIWIEIWIIIYYYWKKHEANIYSICITKY